MADKAEVKIDKVVVHDKKLEAMVKATAKKAGDAAASEKFDAAYVIRLTPKLEFDDRAREIAATCSWEIYEGGRLFPRLKQTKKSTSTATVKPDRITQRNLDDTVGAVCRLEVEGIMKSLKAMP